MDKDSTYYFIGIKGSGMSSLALILHDEGYKVEG
ncbi:Mur ligase domain-containing protein, partial [Enterococcus faecium]|nr:Mur ligase domain-containing protein [Enterococcus faecium]